eukprot:NODE_42_length_34079_cov_0.552619.p26 type:complete len:107 gc:universal NODE_42_length_34079_cov_0.552619:18076-18396(+)
MKLLLYLHLAKMNANALKCKSTVPDFVFDLSEMHVNDCWLLFRFHKDDIFQLITLLEIPDTISLPNGSKCTRTTAFCVLLRRFSYPSRLFDLVLILALKKANCHEL